MPSFSARIYPNSSTFSLTGQVKYIKIKGKFAQSIEDHFRKRQRKMQRQDDNLEGQVNSKSIQEDGIERCPLCGSPELLRQQLSDGRIELICLDLDCSFSRLIDPKKSTYKRDNMSKFTEYIRKLSTEEIKLICENLRQSSEELTGRARRISKRQLAIAQAELSKRECMPEDKIRKLSEKEEDQQDKIPEKALKASNKKTAATIKTEKLPTADAEEDKTHVTASSEDTSLKNNSKNNSKKTGKVPSQFQTPEAIAKRLKAIREYHNKRKQKALKDAISNSNRWLKKLLDTLLQDAERHERAARNYARSPELFTLHIEHSARAFELNRVVDLLSCYVEILETEDKAKEDEN